MKMRKPFIHNLLPDPRPFCLVVLLFLSACGLASGLSSFKHAQQDSTPMDMTMDTPLPEPTPGSTSESVLVTGPHVTIANFTFSPATLTVPVGSTVTWVNQDDIPHTVTSVDGVFHSAALDTDDRFSFRFAKPGEYTYFCSIHPKMVGKIVVK